MGIVKFCTLAKILVMMELMSKSTACLMYLYTVRLDDLIA